MPTTFIDLSEFNVVVEAVIGGAQRVVGSILARIDSDFVPQFVYDRVASTLNGAVNNAAGALRGITRQAIGLGQDPTAFVTGRIHDIVARYIAQLSAGVQPLVGIPVIGTAAQGYQSILGSLMSIVDGALRNMTANGHSIQATATQIASAFERIARQIG